MQALLAVCFRLEVYTGGGGDSKDGLLIPLTAPSVFSPKKMQRERQIEPDSYPPAHVGSLWLPSPWPCPLGLGLHKLWGMKQAPLARPSPSL